MSKPALTPLHLVNLTCRDYLLLWLNRLYSSLGYPQRLQQNSIQPHEPSLSGDLPRYVLCTDSTFLLHFELLSFRSKSLLTDGRIFTATHHELQRHRLDILSPNVFELFRCSDTLPSKVVDSWKTYSSSFMYPPFAKTSFLTVDKPQTAAGKAR